jgi:hypothetical protein
MVTGIRCKQSEMALCKLCALAWRNYTIDGIGICAGSSGNIDIQCLNSVVTCIERSK